MPEWGLISNLIDGGGGVPVGMTLFDQKTNAIVFDVNFWHWRAIVEAVRSLGEWWLLGRPRHLSKALAGKKIAQHT